MKTTEINRFDHSGKTWVQVQVLVSRVRSTAEYRIYAAIDNGTVEVYKADYINANRSVSLSKIPELVSAVENLLRNG